MKCVAFALPALAFSGRTLREVMGRLPPSAVHGTRSENGPHGSSYQQF